MQANFVSLLCTIAVRRVCPYQAMVSCADKNSRKTRPISAENKGRVLSSDSAKACYSYSLSETVTQMTLYRWFSPSYQDYLDYPIITVYHNSYCHCVVTKIGLYGYYSVVLFELQYCSSKFTRNIFEKRAKHIDF